MQTGTEIPNAEARRCSFDGAKNAEKAEQRAQRMKHRLLKACGMVGEMNAKRWYQTEQCNHLTALHPAHGILLHGKSTGADCTV